MIRTKAQPLDDILLKFLRDQGLETPLLEYRVVQAWPKVAGELVSKYTTEVYVRTSMLHVKLKSPALKQNLMMMHKDLANRLNAYVGAQIITDVKFI